MKKWLIQHHEVALTSLVLFMVCITRISMAMGNIAYVLIVLLALVTAYIMRNQIVISPMIKTYAKAYTLMVLCMIPSIFGSDNILDSIKSFLNIWVWKSFLFFIILLFIKRKNLLYLMLTVFLYYVGFDSLVAYAYSMLGIETNGFGRSGGLFNGSVMGMAMVLTAVFPVALVVLWDKNFPKSLRIAAGFSTLAMIFGMLGNQSRGSWIFNMGTSLLVSIRYFMKNILYLGIFLAIVIGLGVTVSQNDHYVNRFKSVTNTTTNGSNLGRIYVWESTIDMIEDHPVIGVGPGEWRKVYRAQYKLPEETQDLNHSHNNFLHIGAESGLLGLIAFVIFGLYVIGISVHRWIQNNNPYDLAVVIGFFSYIFLFGSIDYTWNNSSGIRILWFILAVFLQLGYANRVNENVRG